MFDLRYALCQIKPSDLLNWILPAKVQCPEGVVIAVDGYRKESTKEGERKNRRGGKDRPGSM